MKSKEVPCEQRLEARTRHEKVCVLGSSRNRANRGSEMGANLVKGPAGMSLLSTFWGQKPCFTNRSTAPVSIKI